MVQQLNSKILLFGEYAILHDGMALVIPFDKYHGRFEFNKAGENDTIALQSNEYLKKFCSFISSRMDEKFVLEVKKFEQELNQGLFFRSNIPQGYGLGSSGAIVAAIVLRYLVKAKNLKDEMKVLTLQKIRELKSSLGDLESFFHGVSSGLDPLSSILNEPILCKSSQDIVTTTLPKSSLNSNNVVFLLDTKTPRTTAKMMERFKELYSDESFKRKFDNYIYEDNNEAIESFLSSDLETFYRSISDISAFQLEHMSDFFPPHLIKDIKSGLSNGDFFLKLCGAGGGGFILGFTREWEVTKEKLKNFNLEEIYCY